MPKITPTLPTPVSYLDILSEDDILAIEETKNLKEWANIMPRTHARQCEARNALLHAVVHAKSDMFLDYQDHGFWKNWTSKKSTGHRGILSFAIQSSKDVSWIRRLIDVVQPAKSHKWTEPLQNRNPYAFTQVMNILDEHDLIEEHPSILEAVARSSGWITMLHFFDKGMFATRVPHVEKTLGVRTYVGGRSHKTIPHSEAFSVLWERWGMPDTETMHTLWHQACSRHFPAQAQNPVRDLYTFLQRHHNPNASTWKDNDYAIFVQSMMRHGAFEEMEKKVMDEGWDIPTHVWKDATRGWDQSSMKDKILAFGSKIDLQRELKDSMTDLSTRKRKL